MFQGFGVGSGASLFGQSNIPKWSKRYFGVATFIKDYGMRQAGLNFCNDEEAQLFSTVFLNNLSKKERRRSGYQIQCSIHIELAKLCQAILMSDDLIAWRPDIRRRVNHRDKETAQYIYKFLEDCGGVEALENGRPRTLPPPVISQPMPPLAGLAEDGDSDEEYGASSVPM
ncbi:hypothetical protein HELRODRAFT_184073 [Helobdella robusta]|uniref:WH1 domain-containing protein n=1 Tax=Helobdella robusta TaxID=6412 RepID=T1FKJ2_HELRO|nr:hypothetical protein HELRODRAFT_184073 [Helobdella robusta]ESO08284.1 hypothetical protein HELRODRAFT_184073 [Helobdella robusta]